AALAVIPVEIDCILAYWSNFQRPRGLFVHGQSTRFGLRRLPNLASAALPFLIARRARTGVPQPGERIVTLMGVFPFDIHAFTGGFFHLNGLWICRCNRQNTRFFGLNAPHFLYATRLDRLVRHIETMILGRAAGFVRRMHVPDLLS